MTESTTRPSRADTDPATSAAVDLEGVTKTYGSGDIAVHALKDATLAIPRGELVVILGPSGSGKTTLLNLIGAIDAPTSGSVRVDGIEVSALDARGRTRFRRDHVGFVFQFFNLIPTLTAKENVELIVELLGRRDGAAADHSLDAVGLGDRLDHFPGTLSGGEQQRVAIARAITKQPPLLLCDEPTGALDLDTGRTVLSLLRRLAGREGRTVLIVTHNSAIAGIADREVHLRDGEIVSSEPNADLIDPEDVRW
jgi:putative ABC transport system ATP-binding protein